MSAVCFFEIAAKPKELCKKKPVVCGYTCYEAFDSYLYKPGKIYKSLSLYRPKAQAAATAMTSLAQ